jgi:hypothetical protein
MREVLIALSLAVSLLLTACGGAERADPLQPRAAPRNPPRAAEASRPVPRIGRGPRYRLPASKGLVDAGRPIGSLHCTRTFRERFGTHLEIFANRLDVVIPAGIGVSPPRVRDGAYVRSGRCSYQVRTLEPTGLIEVEKGTKATLGDFFDLWGQPLSTRRLLGFRARQGERVSAFVNGTLRAGDPRRIGLGRHAAIVLEIGGYFPPTKKYVFPEGF